MTKRDAPTIVMTFPTALGVLGGGTIGCIEIARALRGAGANVVLCVAQTGILERGVFRRPPLSEKVAGAETEEMLRDLGVEVVRVLPMRAHFFLDCWPMRRAVLEVADKRRVDGVFGWHHELALLPAPLRRRGVFSGMFVAGWYNHLRPSEIRDNGENAKQRWKRRAERHFLSRGLHRVDKVFAISRWSKQEAIEVFGVPAERVEVVYWGVDPIFATAQHAPAERVTRFLFYGSQNQRKGALEAMEAFARLHQAGHRDWTYKVVWLHTDKVRAHAVQLGIEDRVVPMAPMRHAELVKQLEWAQVAILPSLYESFGLACVEALTSGIPVIAYDCAGVPEVVRHGVDGWLVENGRKDLLDAPILEAMADARRTFEMGCAGRERALRDFTWPRTAAQLLELVEQGRRQQRRPA